MSFDFSVVINMSEAMLLCCLVLIVQTGTQAGIRNNYGEVIPRLPSAHP